nr:subtilisin-like protease SBT5.3 [Tanacetum cinerariifolium]
KDKANDAISYSYTRHINGFVAILEDEEAIQLAKNPKVAPVFLNRGRKLHTTRSWDFIGLENKGFALMLVIFSKKRVLVSVDDEKRQVSTMIREGVVSGDGDLGKGERE